MSIATYRRPEMRLAASLGAIRELAIDGTWRQMMRESIGVSVVETGGGLSSLLLDLSSARDRIRPREIGSVRAVGECSIVSGGRYQVS